MKDVADLVNIHRRIDRPVKAAPASSQRVGGSGTGATTETRDVAKLKSVPGFS
jgi:hypothetical protein